MNVADIYQYEDFRAYLREAGPESLGVDSQTFSLTFWARQLGYSSHRTMAMVLSGKRLPSVDMIHRLSNQLRLNTQQKEYFELLILLERHRQDPKKSEQIKNRLEVLKSLRPGSVRECLEDNSWRLIYKWYFFAIKQLVGCKGFKPSPAWIQKRLGNKVCQSQVREALRTMMYLKLVGQDPESGAWKELRTNLMTRSDVPCHHLRNHHREMMLRAHEAIDSQDVKAREFRSLTFRFDTKRMAEAKDEIRNFLVAFNNKFASEDTDQVYQLNLQCFALTEGTPASDYVEPSAAPV